MTGVDRAATSVLPGPAAPNRSAGAAHRPDPRPARFVAEALGTARTVLNVGAAARGTGPSAPAAPSRPSRTVPSVDTVAGELPFHDGEFDAAMTLLNIHLWDDVRLGLREMRRVTRGPILVLTRDPARVGDFWLHEYAPEVVAAEARRYPPLDELTAALGGRSTVRPVPIPFDCTDGLDEACYGRPDLLLDPNARRVDWTWSSVGDSVRERFNRTLRADLASGAWDRRFGHLRTRPQYEGALVLVRATP
ncbi:class I SAM-dependent methyltransferase [Kitasatospora albolonga]|uniref:methyltransferase domain-containing protein n=1 Tax=Kitasatospora albolonga TaxID=68173 RepID=UPI0031E50F5B